MYVIFSDYTKVYEHQRDLVFYCLNRLDNHNIHLSS